MCQCVVVFQSVPLCSVCSYVFQCVQCVCDRSLPLSRLPVTLVAPLRLRQFCQSDKIQGHPSSPNNFQYSPISIQLKNWYDKHSWNIFSFQHISQRVNLLQCTPCQFGVWRLSCFEGHLVDLVTWLFLPLQHLLSHMVWAVGPRCGGWVFFWSGLHCLHSHLYLPSFS